MSSRSGSVRGSVKQARSNRARTVAIKASSTRVICALVLVVGAAALARRGTALAVRAAVVVRHRDLRSQRSQFNSEHNWHKSSRRTQRLAQKEAKRRWDGRDSNRAPHTSVRASLGISRVISFISVPSPSAPPEEPPLRTAPSNVSTAASARSKRQHASKLDRPTPADLNAQASQQQHTRMRRCAKQASYPPCSSSSSSSSLCVGSGLGCCVHTRTAGTFAPAT